MTTLAEVKSLVADELNRGTTLDSAIDAKIRQAIRWFERNEKLQYMYQWASFTIDADAANPRQLALPARLRSWDFFRILKDVAADGSAVYEYLRLISPLDVGELVVDRPKAFWLNGSTEVVLATIPKEDYTAEWAYWAYTDTTASALQDATAHWLFDNAVDLIIHQTCLLMAPYMHEEAGWIQIHKALRDESLNTLIHADDDYTQGPAAQASMGVYKG